MMVENQKYSESSVRITRWKVASFGCFTSTVFLLIVATFPGFFLFNPMEQTDSLRLLILLLSTIAWISIMAGPALIFTLVAFGRRRAVHALPYVALGWPVMLVINHLHLLVTTGDAYLNYLVVYPVFIVTDIATPLLLIVLWLEFRWEEHYIHEKVRRTPTHRAARGAE